MTTVVIGVGNDFRGDDGAGLAVVRSLRGLSLGGAEFVELNNELSGLLESLQACDAAIIVDAVKSGAQPGTIHRFDAGEKPLPGNRSQRSTHAISLSSLLELARAQGTFPRHVLVFGIEGRDFAHTNALTPEVKKAVDRVVSIVQAELSGIEVEIRGRPSPKK